MSKSRAKSESNIYHVMARGDGRQIVFENDEDRKLFLALLRNRKQQDAPIFAWCLMDNHFHLVIQASLPVLSLMMQQIMSQYASSFNMRHQHTGHVFNQRFKSEPINDDSYFLTVVRYVHQNPIKAGITKTCFYPWSSYGEYFDAPRITSTALILEMLGGIGAFNPSTTSAAKKRFLTLIRCVLKQEAYLTKRLSIERSAFIIAISFETSREPREANEIAPSHRSKKPASLFDKSNGSQESAVESSRISRRTNKSQRASESWGLLPVKRYKHITVRQDARMPANRIERARNDRQCGTSAGNSWSRAIGRLLRATIAHRCAMLAAQPF